MLTIVDSLWMYTVIGDLGGWSLHSTLQWAIVNHFAAQGLLCSSECDVNTVLFEKALLTQSPAVSTKSFSTEGARYVERHPNGGK